MNEDDVMIANPVYSFNLCRMECRMKMAMKYCGCIPHFYRNRGKVFFFIYYILFMFKSFRISHADKNGRRYPFCGFEGLNCLSSMKSKIKLIIFLTYVHNWIKYAKNAFIEEIISLESTTRKIDCHCYANCDNSYFFVQAYVR